MELGQLVDFCIEWNEINGVGEEADSKTKKKKDTVRNATQADWDAFWG